MEGTSMQVFNFNGNQLDVTRKGNDVFVGIKRVSEALGVDPWTQQEKLKEKPWARTRMIPVRDSAGREQETSMIHLDSLPMWLATIDTNRVAEEARPKLIEFQCNCAKVLRDYFFGKAKAFEPRRPTLRQLVLQWVDDHVETRVSPETVMLDIGVVATSAEAEHMPSVKRAVSRALLAFGVEPGKPDPLGEFIDLLGRRMLRSQVWALWQATHPSEAGITPRALYVAMREAGFKDLKTNGLRFFVR